MEKTSSNSTINLFVTKHKKVMISLLILTILFLLKNILLDLILFLFSSLAVIIILFFILLASLNSIKWLFGLLFTAISIYSFFALILFLVS